MASLIEILVEGQIEHIQWPQHGRYSCIDGSPRLAPRELERSVFVLGVVGAEQLREILVLSGTRYAPIHLAWGIRQAESQVRKPTALAQAVDKLVGPVSIGMPMDQVTDAVDRAHSPRPTVGNRQDMLQIVTS